MGYTHYYYVNSYYDQDKWDALIKDVKKLLELPIPKALLIGNSEDHDYSWYEIKNLGELINGKKVTDGNQGHYNINEAEISFNGVGELAHEQFHLWQKMPPDVFERQEEFAKKFAIPPELQPADESTSGSNMAHQFFECTKTARKPYDIVVQCCLILAKKHFDTAIAISSDGGKDEWETAIDIIEKNFGYKVKTTWTKSELFPKVI